MISNVATRFEKYYKFLTSYLFSKCTYLIFFVTSKCNARCRMCFYWQDIEHSEDKKTLSLAEIELIAKCFKGLAYLSITGGEPTLREGLDDIAYYFYKHSGTRFINFTTNGLLPERTLEAVYAILNKCPNANLKVNLSLDHIGVKDDEIRGVNGAFEKTLETFSRLETVKSKHKNLYLLITTILSAYNKNEIFDIIDYVKDKIKPDAHSIALVRGDAREKKALEVSPEHYKDVTKYLMTASGSKKGFMQKALELMMEANLEGLCRNRMIIPCVAGRKMLTMTDEGTIIPCEVIHGIFKDRDFTMGNIRDYGYDIGKLLDSVRAKDVARFIRQSRCHCSFECAALWNIAFNPQKYPKLLMRMTG